MSKVAWPLYMRTQNGSTNDLLLASMSMRPIVFTVDWHNNLLFTSFFRSFLCVCYVHSFALSSTVIDFVEWPNAKITNKICKMKKRQQWWHRRTYLIRFKNLNWLEQIQFQFESEDIVENQALIAQYNSQWWYGKCRHTADIHWVNADWFTRWVHLKKRKKKNPS